MSIFRDYFREGLRLPFINSGPIGALVDGAAALLDAAHVVVSTLRDQFFPGRCEDAYLVRFAASRGISRNPLEPDEHWQERVRFAYLWWSRGGRKSAMAEALKAGFGLSRVIVVNMRGIDPDKWASFRVILEGDVESINERLEQIKWAINEVKPARSRLVEVIVRSSYNFRTGVSRCGERLGYSETLSTIPTI